MKKLQKLLGIIFLFSSLLMVSCGNSPESNAKKSGKLYENLLILKVKYNKIDHSERDKWEVEYDKADDECEAFDDEVREKHRDDSEYMMDYTGELMNIMRQLDKEYKNKYPGIRLPK